MIYHIEFAKTGTGLSGGEVSMLELIKEFAKKGIYNCILTTDNGRETYLEYLPKSEYITFRIINSYKSEKKLGYFLSYVCRIPKIKRLLKEINFNSISEQDYVMCHSEFFPNSLGFKFFLNLVKNNDKSIKSAAFYHMKAPNIFKGYEGEFTGSYQLPRPTILHYILNQYLYKIITPVETKIFTVNKYYLDLLTKKYPNNKIIVLDTYGGHRLIKDDIVKDIDLLWLGRFHRQKGILDFIEVVALLRTKIPNIKVTLAGDGDEKIKQSINEAITKYGLEENILLPGFLTGTKKDEILKLAKIFVMTSYYESFGLVIVEAMSSKAAVIAYDLPVYDVFEEGIQTVGILNKQALANTAQFLLSNKNELSYWSKKAYDTAKKHSWLKTANKILSTLN